MADLLVVRHGEPILRGVFLGALDVGLSEEGWRQARGMEIEPGLRVYASPLRRAWETASVLREPATPVQEFRELGHGPWEGLRWDEIETRFPEEAARKLADWTGYTAPGAESWEDFRARVARGLQRVEAPAVIVAHLGVNSVLRELLTGESPMNFMQDYCEILRLAL